MYKRLLVLSLLLLTVQTLRAQNQPLDTTVVETITFDSLGRAGFYHFPDSGSYQRVLLDYTMRCHHALVSNSSNTEQGCGQWDYNCETYIWDSTRTDSLDNIASSAAVSNYPANTNFPYTKIPSFSITRNDEKIVRYPSGTSFVVTPGDTTLAISGWINDSWNRNYTRKDYILPASKNIWRGIRQDSLIEGIVFPAGLGAMQDFRIRLHTIKPGTYDSLSLFSDASFIEVFHASVAQAPGPDTLFFYRPFKWDTASDIVMDLSWSGQAVRGPSPESALSFGGSEFVPIPAATLNRIYDQITVAFWAYGDTSYLPGSNSTLCEGLDANNDRQISIQLPWSNGTVYWDCGSDTHNNYDRVQKTPTKIQAAGRWNYWAFTKNATSGKMAIYLNGELWASDTGKYRPIDATKMVLGSAISSGIGYYGDVRQFAMFNTALDSNQIRRIMMQDSAIPALQPATYFKLDEGSGSTIANSAYGMPNSTVVGVPVWHSIWGKDLPNNFAAFTFHPNFADPNFSFLQLRDSVAAQITDRYTYDTVPDHAHSVTDYRIGRTYAFHQNDTVIASDTLYGYYLASKSYTYDETGKKIDSTNIAAQDTIKPTSLYYWTRSPQKFELMSFVTPYGINLDLGKNGKMYEFDVTDYLPELRGWHRLTMERGSGQEEFNLKFLFIKGIPPRNVLDMQQLWPMTEESYQTIQSNLRYPPLRVYLDPQAKGYKIRSFITGHGGTPNGLNGEFTPQWHDIFVNQTNYRRFVYKICSLDPLYPQGGTWTLNRAGWCPGMATDLAEYEITGTVTPGDSATIDYNVEGGVGDSRYDPGTQLVSYGPPNFTLDAAVVSILRPSDRIEFARINPACDQPIITLQNTGSTPLDSVRIEYYVDNGPHDSYEWHGHLNFLDTQDVALPVDSLNFWTTQDTGQFHVDISQPNGGTDQYDQNNHYSSNYIQPPHYSGIIVVNLRTNNDPQDNYYEVLNDLGDTIFSNGGFDPTTSYYDSLILPVGCYTLVFHDDGEDGLSYWANPQQGNGYLYLRQTAKNGKLLHSFNPDFGKGVQYDFSIVNSPLAVGSTKPVVEHIGLYPDPNAGQLNLDLEGLPVGMITLDIVDATGRALHREQRFTDALGNLHAAMNLQGLPAGTYFLRITTQTGETTKQFVVK